MGLASVAFGKPDRGTGRVDGSITGALLSSSRSGGDSSSGVDRVGQVLSPCDPAELTLREVDTREADQQVGLHQLWFHLAREQQLQFGSCFSRMLLKCLGGCQQEEETE